MRKIICIMATATLLLSSSSIALAKSNHEEKQNEHQVTQHQVTRQQFTQHKNTQTQNHKIKVTKQEFKLSKSPVIKYGRYKLPLRPITKGMGATVTFDKATAVLTVVKDTNTIVIDFKNKTVLVNGVADIKSGLFTAKNNKKMNVLIKYIANVLGVRVCVDKDKVIVEVPELDLPTNVIVTTFGTTNMTNKLNSTTLYMTATANITAGQATGGEAKLYVGSKLVATDEDIAATDTTVTFTTSDNTPTIAEMQADVPEGGVVTVKLYSKCNHSVKSAVANPTLVVDYIAPTITSVSSAAISVSGSAIYLNVTGAGAIGDAVDVTKISLYDTTLGKTYQLTNTAGIGSSGVVNSENSLIINIGSADMLGLAGFGNTTMFLNLSVGALLSDVAGNTSTISTAVQSVPVTVIK